MNDIDLNRVSNEVLPCPFCGGAAMIVKSSIWTADVYFAKCVNCLCRTEPFLVGYNLACNKTTTPQDAIQMAINRWNRRCPQVDTRTYEAEGKAI